MGVLLARNAPVHLVLGRQTLKHIRGGHPWVYSDSLVKLPSAESGSLALLKTKDGQIVAKGFYDPHSKLAFRVLAVKERVLDEELVLGRLSRAVDLRRKLFTSDTTGYRLINGEGDRLPGLVCDIYGTTAVLKLDGEGPAGFYNAKGMAAWLQQQLKLKTVYLKYRSGGEERGRVLLGEAPSGPVKFTEHGLKFMADVVHGQKTGFFLDQRENRKLMQAFSPGSRVLNLFGYTGGFSIYAGAAGASHVTTVDVAAAALKDAAENWAANKLRPSAHSLAAEDCFEFLTDAAAAKEAWDVTICDPPSFAPNQQSVPAAQASYERLFQKAAAVTKSGGILALASCSSHIPFSLFHEICDNALAKARRNASVLGVYGQPADHPYPAACPELRYLKFVVHHLD